MQLENLRYFLEVLKAGSITKAAGNVFISQQGLSKSVMSLEKELQVTLLNRGDSGKATPTEAGQEFAHIAQVIVDNWDHLREQMALYDEDGTPLEASGSTRILTTTYLANMLHFLFGSNEIQNRLFGKVSVYEKSFGKIRKALESSASDTVALVNVCPAALADDEIQEKFDFTPLITMDLLLMCSVDFPPVKRKYVTADDLRDIPLALYNDPMLSTLLRSFIGDEDFNILMHTTSQSQIQAAVMRGDAATFSDTFASIIMLEGPDADEIRRKCKFVPVRGETEFSAGLLSLKGAERSPSSLRYESFCRHYIEMKFSDYIKRRSVRQN